MIEQYVNRRIDVLAFQGAAPRGEALLEQQLFGNTAGEVCTGIQKLAQHWLLEFLTAAGSCRFLPDRGTQFMPRLVSGGLQHETDVQVEFNFAAATASRNLAVSEPANAPTDERLQSARLTSIVISAGSLILHVELTSQAGETRAIILPVPVAPVTPDF